MRLPVTFELKSYKHSGCHQISEAFPLRMAQSWLWGNQIALYCHLQNHFLRSSKFVWRSFFFLNIFFQSDCLTKFSRYFHMISMAWMIMKILESIHKFTVEISNYLPFLYCKTISRRLISVWVFYKWI